MKSRHDFLLNYKTFWNYDYFQGEKIDKTVGTRDDVEIRTLSKSNLVISKVNDKRLR